MWTFLWTCILIVLWFNWLQMKKKELSGGPSLSMCEGGERRRNHRQTSEDLYTRRVEGEQVILDLKLEKRWEDWSFPLSGLWIFRENFLYGFFSWSVPSVTCDCAHRWSDIALRFEKIKWLWLIRRETTVKAERNGRKILSGCEKLSKSQSAEWTHGEYSQAEVDIRAVTIK